MKKLILFFVCFFSVSAYAFEFDETRIRFDGVYLDVTITDCGHISANDMIREIGCGFVWNESTDYVLPCYFAAQMGFGFGYINDTFIFTSKAASKVPVLMYHHILPDEKNTVFYDNAWTISTANFAQQMAYLSANGFYTPTLDELENFLFNGHLLPLNSVQIQFDDGYYSNFVYAYPILLQHGLRAVIFPITRYSEKYGDVQSPMDYNCLTYASAKTLRSRPHVFETASHTHNLHDTAWLSQRTMLVEAPRELIISDTLRSFEFVSNTRAFAYPQGQFNDTVIEALREAGITMAFTTRRGYVSPTSDPFRLDRFTIFRETCMYRFRNIVNRRLVVV